MEKVKIIQKILETDKDNGYVWYLLALEHIELKNLSGALNALSQCLMYCDNEIKGEIVELLGRISAEGINKAPVEEDNADGESENTVAKIEEAAVKISDGRDNKIVGLFDNAEESEDEEDIELDEYEDSEERGDEEDYTLKELELIGGGKNVRYVNFDDRSGMITFSDVGGLDNLKKAIELKIIKPFRTPGLFAKFKKKVGGGILLYGPPGCGKTFIAKATAGECDASFLPVDIADILSPYFGQSAINVKEIFAEARRKKPCVLFIDELDTLGYNRAKSTSDNLRPIIDQLLNEVDGIQNDNTNLLILGATNTPWDVDGALKRPGRFDKTLFVPPPDKKAREAIFRLKLKDKPTAEIDYGYLASVTELYSGADIENVVETAVENVISEILEGGEERKVTTKDLTDVIQVVRPTTIEWLRTVGNYVKYANQGGFFNEVEDFIRTYKKYI